MNCHYMIWVHTKQGCYVTVHAPIMISHTKLMTFEYKYIQLQTSWHSYQHATYCSYNLIQCSALQGSLLQMSFNFSHSMDKQSYVQYIAG